MVHELLFVGVGGATGSMARYLLASNVLVGCSLWGFPAGTFAVNIIGSILIGLLMGILQDGSALQWFFVTGLCGGFTTFSTFSADTIRLLKLEKWDAAMLYIVLSVIVALLCTSAGWWLGSSLKKLFA